MPKITFAFCTFNRADRLDKLVSVMRQQSCPVPFEILAINNNSADSTIETLKRLELLPGPALRWVTETKQGIVPARNRAIEEALESDVLVFIDDDELPLPGLLEAVSNAIFEEGADCVGGPIRIDFEPYGRPKWLDKKLAGFLGEIDYGLTAFWIKDGNTPVWSGNVAYRMAVFRTNLDLRFDQRYNREGAGIGGGSDAVMFQVLLKGNYKIRYRPDMVITHFVDPWKLKRNYFLKLHYRAGLRKRHDFPEYRRTILGVPPFLFRQLIGQIISAGSSFIISGHGQIRGLMNVTHTLGLMRGLFMKKYGK